MYQIRNILFGAALALLVPSGICCAQIKAQDWNRQVFAGWNLGNSLESTPVGWETESVEIDNPASADDAETAWGNPVVTNSMIAAVRDAGFNAIRIPVRWGCHVVNEETMEVSEAWMTRVRQVIDMCMDNGMFVIINTHHEKWLESQPEYAFAADNNRRLALLWTNIATALADYDYRLAFAASNEVHKPKIWDWPAMENLQVQNSYNQTFVDAVRATGGNNLQRHLVVQTYVCNAEYGLNGNFIVPSDIEGNDNDYMSVEFHYYVPWDYCGTNKFYFWGDSFSKFGPVSQNDEKAMSAFFDRIAATWSTNGLGVIIGEWGITDHYQSDSIERIRQNMTYYAATIMAEARRRGFSAFVWDNNVYGNGEDKYGIFDRCNGMKVRTPWIIDGIMSGARSATSPVLGIRYESLCPSGCILSNGVVEVRSGMVGYDLGGRKLRNHL